MLKLRSLPQQGMEIMFLMSNCRTGCATQSHDSWGECARNANISTANMQIALVSRGTDAELGAYRDARKQGIQPASTKMHDVIAATRASDKLGRAVQA